MEIGHYKTSPFLIFMYHIEFSNYELFGYSVIVQNKIVKS